MASIQECATVAGTAERAMWRLFHQGGATSFVPDNSVVRLIGGSSNGGLAFVSSFDVSTSHLQGAITLIPMKMAMPTMRATLRCEVLHF